MESQMTVDEQLNQMNEAEFKAFLEACTHKTKKTLEQAAMFSQLDRPAKAPEEQIPPLTTTKHSSSLQSLNQSHSSNSRNSSQIHNASEAGNSSVSSSSPTGGTVGNSSGYPCNNNTHHHHPHLLNSNFSSNNNNHNSTNNTNCTSTSLSSTSSTSGDHLDPSSFNSQNQQTVNCVTVVSQNNNSHNLYTPSSYYSSASSSPSHTEEDTATTSANSNSSSPNNTSYSTTTFTAAAPPSSRPYYQPQSRQNPSSTTPSISTATSSTITPNLNLKRPPTKPVQNHIEVKATPTLPSPYFFNCRTADYETEQYREFGGHSSKDVGGSGETGHVSEIEPPYFQGATSQFHPGNVQLLRGDYFSLQSLTDCGTRGHQISPRHSRSGTPVQGESTSSSTSLSITRRNHGGPRSKRSKETVLLASDREYIGNTIGDNIDDLVSYISGQSEKPQPQMKKAKKKGKRKDTLSKSHSLDEKTLGIDVNPEIETRSASSTIFENKSGSVETPCVDINSDSLDLSLPSGLKVDTIRSHSTADFITVTNRKKNKALKSGEQLKMKSENVQNEDSACKVEQMSVPKQDGNGKESNVLIVETSKPEVSVVSKKEAEVKNEYVIKQEIGPVMRVDSTAVINTREFNSRQEITKKPEASRKIQPTQEIQKKIVESQKSVEIRRRHENPLPRRHEQGRRTKDSNPRDDSQIREPRRPFLRQIGESRPYNAVVAEQAPRNSQLPQKLPSDLTQTSQDAVKFCGVNFDNKPTLLAKPNVNVEFGFGVTDVLSKLATSTPAEEHKPIVEEPSIDPPVKSLLSNKTNENAVEDKDPVVSVPSTVVSNQVNPGESTPLSETPTSTKDAQSSAITDKESLLGRHPQAVLSPPVHYIPISMPVQMASGSGYPGQNIYHHLSSPALQVPVGVLPYYPGSHLQQSAPIMTALPTPGTGNIPPQYMNQVTLTQSQHQLYHQHQMFQHHLHTSQAQYALSQQQPIIQYQMKPSPTQQPYPGNQSSLAQFSPGQTAVQQHAQSNYSTQIQAAGNYNYRQNNASRSNHSLVNPNSPQMGNYGLQSPQLLQQYGPGYQQYPNSHTNYSLGGPPTGVHYNYHRGNNPRSYQNITPSNYIIQQTPTTAQNQAHAQTIRSLPPQGPVSSPVVVTGPTPEDATLPPVTVQVCSRYMLVNPDTNPLGQYYTPPILTETDMQYARQGEEYATNYVANLQERIEQDVTTVHRI